MILLKNWKTIGWLVCGIFLVACHRAEKLALPGVDLSAYVLEKDFRLEVVAAEPLVEAPVAMTFDARGRIWVLEMREYMPDMDAQGEGGKNSRIVILEDKDGDGRMDRSRIFLEGLSAPRALALAYGGVLYAEPPNLWWVENRDDRPGDRILVDSTYALGGNIEHQPNGLLRNLDNWWYNAKSTACYRRVDGKWEKETTAFRGQWGMTQDDLGRLFYNDNSNQLQGDYLNADQLLQNPHFVPLEGINEQITTDQRVYPLHATAVNRGYIDGVLDEEQKLKRFTSACGPVIYRGDQFPPAYQGNAFVCAPEANLIKRNLFRSAEGRLSASQAYPDREFLAATDEAFRPVNAYNAPDGSLYLVDFHRGVIQHKVYMTAYLREQLVDRGLDSIIHYGRILRVVYEKNPRSPVIDLSQLSPLELVEKLQSSNGWTRDKAQQILVETAPPEIVAALEQVALDRQFPLGQIHALWTLEGLGQLSTPPLVELLASPDTRVAKTALQLLSVMENASLSSDVWKSIATMLNQKNVSLDLQLSSSLGQLASQNQSAAFGNLYKLLQRHTRDSLYYSAVIAGLSGHEKAFNGFLQSQDKLADGGVFQTMLSEVLRNIEQNLRFRQGLAASPTKDKMTAGLALYRQHCASCHRPDGRGITNLAPPLYHSNYLEGEPEVLILLTLHGLQGPIHVNGQRYDLNAVMPGLTKNEAMSDEDIAAILTFTRNAFGAPRWIAAEQVAKLRAFTPQEGEMYREASLWETAAQLQKEE